MNNPVQEIDPTIVQRVANATPEQLVALLLEGAQCFLIELAGAIEARDMGAKARVANRVFAILEELDDRLDHASGSELVQNLSRIYEWWSHEVLEATSENTVDRLKRVAVQMEELKGSWLGCSPAKTA